MQKILGLALGVTVMMMGYVEGMKGLTENNSEKRPGDSLASLKSKLMRKDESIATLDPPKPGTPPDVTGVDNLNGLSSVKQEVVPEPGVKFGDNATLEEWRAYSRGVLALLQPLRAKKNFSSAEKVELNAVIATWLKQLKESGVLATVREDLRTTVYGGDDFSAERLDRVELLFRTAEICLHATYCNNDVKNELNKYAKELLDAAKEEGVLNEDEARHSMLESEDAAKLRRVIERINGD